MANRFKRKLSIFVVLILFLQFLPYFSSESISIPFTTLNINPGAFSLINPSELDTAGSLTSASATMANSRLSYYGKVSGVHSAGVQTIDIDVTGNADNNTNHLFPNDSIAIGPNGGLTVGAITDANTFTTTTGLTVGVSDQDPVYASQSGALTISFTLTTTNIPASGYVQITLPDPSANGNDGAPNTESTLAANGFDLNGMGTGDVVTSGGTGCTWDGTETLTPGSGSGHIYKQVTSTQCTGGTITVTFDGTTADLINPAPIDTGHTQGTADYYQISIGTYDGSDTALNSVDVMVAPVEAVFVSATVDESLTFVVAGITADTGSYCGVTRTASSPDSTAYSVPWGTIATAYTAATHNANQSLTITTNANSGYKVYIEESDQMGRNGNTCTGATPSAGDYNFSGNYCIRDTVCDATGCNHTTLRDWGTDPSSYPGFGYSLEDTTGTDAKFEYNDAAATFNAKTPADIEASESPTDTDAEIMTSSSPTSSSAIYACYRIDVPGDQPAGYYYNRIQYTAVATF